MTAEILDIDPDEYHRRPAFSSTPAGTLIAQSPLHAWQEHRAFGAKDAPEDGTKLTDRGSVIHRLTLGKGKDYEPLDFKDWRTDKAKDARSAARKAGKVPILVADLEDAETAAAAIRIGLADRGLELDGQSEVAVEWDEPTPFGPLRCRAMFDHVWFAQGRILDLKVTGDASPEAVQRNAERMGYGIQAAAYRRALVALFPDLAGRTDFLFAFCEPAPPWAMNVSRPDSTFDQLGDVRWERACAIWARCLRDNHWPGYGTGINPITPPEWVVKRELIYGDGYGS